MKFLVKSGSIVAVAILALCSCREHTEIIPMPPAPVWKSNREYVMAHPPKGMRFVKGGTFRMGGLDRPYDSLAEAKHIADSGFKVGLSWQLPSHPVTVGDFFMDTTEVTEREWKYLLGKPPHESHGDSFPVVGATWYQILENPYGHDDTRRGGMALMEEGTSDPGIFTARSDLVVARGPQSGPDNLKTRLSRSRQYRDPTDYLGFRTVLQVR